MRVVHTRHGYMMLDDESKDFITGWLLLNGEYEWSVVELCGLLVGAWEDGVILDIGANVGTVALPLARSFPNFQIHCYEPQRVVAYQLMGNVALNRLWNVTVHQHALGNSEDILQVQMPNYSTAENIGAFSLSAVVNQNEPSSQGQGAMESVIVRCLDKMEGFPDIRLIKLDVEGYELNVLQGARATLKKHDYPPIVYECWDYHAWWSTNAEELHAWLHKCGYKTHKMDKWTNVAIHPEHPVKMKVRADSNIVKYTLSKDGEKVQGRFIKTH